MQMKKWVVVGCAALALCAANGAADPDVVAYWPFGAQGFADMSGNGYALVGGSDARMGDGFVSMFGTDAGNAEASMKTTSPVALSALPALTVEFWIRWHSTTLFDQIPFIEAGANYNDNAGAIGIQQGTTRFAAWEMLQASSKTGRCTGTNPFGNQLTSWHHVAIVYPKGAYADFHIYVDGKKNDAGTGYEKSSDGVDFHNDVFYIGGRAGLGRFDVDLAKLRLLGRRMTAEEVAARYAESYPYASNDVVVVGSPRQYECQTLTPAYGRSAHNLAIGEEFRFSAGAGRSSGEEIGSVHGWSVRTNAFVDGEYVWLPYLEGEGKQGAVPYPGTAMRVEWQWTEDEMGIRDVTATSAAFAYRTNALPAGTLVVSMGTISNKLHTVWKRAVNHDGDRIDLTGLNSDTPHYYLRAQVKNGAAVLFEHDFEFTLAGAANVAYWPFGVHRLQDASGRGHALSAGSEVSVGAHATFSGSTDENAMKSTSKLTLSQLEGLTIDYWVRPHADEVHSRTPFVEIAENYNNYRGAVTVQQGLDSIAIGERVIVGSTTSSALAMSESSRNPFGADAATNWHHVVAVFPKGVYADFRLYVDGVNESHTGSYSASTAGVPFYDDILYLGGRAGNRTHRLDLDEVRFSGVKRTAAEVAELYAAGTFARTGEARPALLTKGHVLVQTTEPVESYGFYPKVGAVAGRQAGETVILKAPEVLLNEDGTESRLSVLGATVSTNMPGTATWLPWRKVRRTECSFAYPEGDSAVRVDWNVGRRSGFLLMLK